MPKSKNENKRQRPDIKEMLDTIERGVSAAIRIYRTIKPVIDAIIRRPSR